MPILKFFTSLTVFGQCDQCKLNIEAAMNRLEPIHSAVWNIDTRILHLEYDHNGITVKEIHNEINALGYSTDLYEPTLEAYKSLPKSCRHSKTFNKIIDQS